MFRSRLAPLLVLLCVFSAPPFAGLAFAGPPTLEQMEAQVRDDFKSVTHLSADGLTQMLTAAPDDIVLIDVRELEEYEVSRLPNAVQVDPGTRARGFTKRYAELVEGKTVVFYCSVGVRSSIMAKRVQKRLTEAGANAVYNLEGGLFRWHNDARSGLTDALGATDLMHPYDQYWGQLLTSEPTKISYTPKPR